MNTTANEAAPEVSLLSIIKLYSERFSQEGVALRLNVKPAVITRMLSRHGLKQAEVMRRIRIGETPEQIVATAKPVNVIHSAGNDQLNKAVVDFLAVFERITSGSNLPAELQQSFDSLKVAAGVAGLIGAIPTTQPAVPPFLASTQGQQADQQAGGTAEGATNTPPAA